jgi:hypothetical protein
MDQEIRRTFDDLRRQTVVPVRNLRTAVHQLKERVEALSSMAEDNQSAFVTDAARRRLESLVESKVAEMVEAAMPELVKTAVSLITEKIFSMTQPAATKAPKAKR